MLIQHLLIALIAASTYEFCFEVSDAEGHRLVVTNGNQYNSTPIEPSQGLVPSLDARSLGLVSSSGRRMAVYAIGSGGMTKTYEAEIARRSSTADRDLVNAWVQLLPNRKFLLYDSSPRPKIVIVDGATGKRTVAVKDVLRVARTCGILTDTSRNSNMLLRAAASLRQDRVAIAVTTTQEFETTAEHSVETFVCGFVNGTKPRRLGPGVPMGWTKNGSVVCLNRDIRGISTLRLYGPSGKLAKSIQNVGAVSLAADSIFLIRGRESFMSKPQVEQWNESLTTRISTVRINASFDSAESTNFVVIRKQ